MHLGLVSLSYPFGGPASGVGIHNRTVARALVKAGHRVTVVALNPGGTIRVETDGVDARLIYPGHAHWYASRLPGGSVLAPAIRELEYARAVWDAVRIIDARRPLDIVEGSETGGLFFCQKRGARRYRTILRLHGERYTIARHRPGAAPGLGLRLQRWLQHRALAAADVVTSPSQAHADAVEAEMGRTLGVRVLPNLIETGLDGAAETPSAPPALAAQLRAQGQKIILYVGWVHPGKGLAPLLEAAGRLAENGPEVHLVCAGAPHPHLPKADRDALVAAAGMTGRAHFVGYLDHPALAAWYAHADVFAMPSYYETFGNVFLEAMAHGLPIVAFDAGAAREVIGDAGLLVSPDDPDGLAGALGDLLTDDARRERLGAAGRHRVAAQFAPEVVLPQYVAMYEALAEGPSAP